MVVFESDQLDRTEEFLCAHYAPMRIASAGDPGVARIARTTGGSLSVDHLDLGFAMNYDVTPLGRICLCDIAAGTVADHGIEGTSTRESFGPGELFSLAPPDRGYQGQINQARYSITLFDPALLDQVAGPTRGHEPVRLLDHRPLSTAAAERLRRAIEHLGEHVLTDEQQPLVVSTASQYLAACVLAAFPTSARLEPTSADRHDAHPATVRRAVAHIDTDPARDLTLAAIADAACVTPRALQYAFRRHLGITPMTYLRRVRLDAAHHDLRTADPAAGHTVTTIARRWGFADPSRFATAYRHAYGRTPSHTLHHPP